MKNYYKEKSKPEMLEYGIEFFRQKTGRREIAANAHVHEAVELLFIEEGSFTVNCDSQKCNTGAGDLVLFRSNCIHTVCAEGGDNNSYYVLKMSPSLLFSLFPERGAGKYILDFMIFSENSKFLWYSDELLRTEIPMCFRRLEKIFSSNLPTRDIEARARAFLVICELICEFNRENKTGESLTSAVFSQIYEGVRYMNEHYAEDLSAEQMAQMLNISYSYFSRIFVKATGTSFSKYLNLVRIRKAEELLSRTKISITEAAGLVGFNSVSHFIATYKKIKGTTPHKYKSAGVSK